MLDDLAIDHEVALDEKVFIRGGVMDGGIADEHVAAEDLEPSARRGGADADVAVSIDQHPDVGSPA
ncbi:hypothetical protein HYZ80_03470 [Candidatus Parcubacteria bacterium]|nr:hypothetical protein [Candidatus Parcubacteria bacterium]